MWETETTYCAGACAFLKVIDFADMLRRVAELEADPLPSTDAPLHADMPHEVSVIKGRSFAVAAGAMLYALRCE